ncbi:MAG: carbohydrate ABC transporter permease, partial [Acidobacteria bacterium]|nr:carbohydrate ABC transporter permease [Acidobacteriota bacterium]
MVVQSARPEIDSRVASKPLATRYPLPATLAVYGLLVLAAVVALVPFAWVLSLSLKTQAQAFLYPPTLIPDPATLQNYANAIFGPLPFTTFFRNTLIIAILVIVGDLLSCSLIAYGFARFRFPGRDLLFLVLLSTLMVPFIVRLVPLFVMFQQVGWINTFLPLVVPAFFGTPLFIFLMRQFFLTIPGELVDAAKIDGANELQVWWRIMVPLSKPVMAAVSIFAFQATWNDFLAPLVFLQKSEVKTVILGLYAFLGLQPDYPTLMAAAVTSILPMVAIFFLFQNFFVRGITVTGLKA